ncbi:MAG: formate dehydrogenase subunit gamma [Alphaproteobacteria bacterium]|jgi:formate dehydrogenase subunit gamma
MGKPVLKFCRLFAVLGIFVLAFGGTPQIFKGAEFTSSAFAQQNGGVPGDSIGNTSTSDMWRTIRRGNQGAVSLPDRNTGVMIQSEGENWRAFRNGTMSNWGVWLLGGVLVILLVYFLIRGRIKVDYGFSGRLVERFNNVDRFAHWLTASSFVVLGLTGLNMLYGRYVIKPLIGGDAFSTITMWGKYAHNFLGFAFMVGIILILMLWVRDNMPNRHDLIWLSKAGGLFSKGVHPPARKFNAGQKILFWMVVITGASLSFSGLCLLFPFEFSPFASTFALLNVVGFDLPTNLTIMQEMQLSQAWHGILSLIMIAVILAHIYIGWLGMEGAYDAMGTGYVDENWAHQHHNLWMEENETKGGGDVTSGATSDKPDV